MSKAIYRTKDGQADYGFSLERQSNGEYRAYIQSQPGYQGRSNDAHSTHRYTDGDRRYICYTGTLTTESQAKSVAAIWADNTQTYIKTGRSF
jgi:hypothetical protein